MPNGKDHKTSTAEYNREWCDERHNKQDKEIAKLWGEEHGGIKAIWNKLDSLNNKLWGILIGQFAIFGGIVAILIKEVL